MEAAISFEESCAEELAEMKKALEEWQTWTHRASLPPATTPLDQGGGQGIFLTGEQIRALSDAAKKRDVAWERVKRANEAVSACQEKHRK